MMNFQKPFALGRAGKGCSEKPSEHRHMLEGPLSSMLRTVLLTRITLRRFACHAGRRSLTSAIVFRAFHRQTMYQGQNFNSI